MRRLAVGPDPYFSWKPDDVDNLRRYACRLTSGDGDVRSAECESSVDEGGESAKLRVWKVPVRSGMEYI